MEDVEATEGQQHHMAGVARWVTLAATPLFILALGMVAAVVGGPHVHNPTWSDVFGVIAAYALVYFVPMFFAGVAFEQWRDARRR